MAFWIIFTLFLIGIFLFGLFLLFETRKRISLIKSGKEDQEIQEDKGKNSKPKNRILSLLGDVVALILLALFAFGLIIRIVSDAKPKFQVLAIGSGSMSYKNEGNQYLFDENLDNQIPTYSLIGIEKVDSLAEIKKYDVICYLNPQGVKIVHRVREVNNDGTLSMRGDANAIDDSLTVEFSQVVGRYNGFIIPYVGNFVFFLQSNYGILCLSTIAAGLILYEIRIFILNKEVKRRKRYLSEEKGGKNEKQP